MISPEEFVERLCRLGADRGPRRFPRNPRDREILMKSITMLLDSRRSYSEPEINEALRDWNLEVDEIDVRATIAAYLDHRERRGSQHRSDPAA